MHSFTRQVWRLTYLPFRRSLRSMLVMTSLAVAGSCMQAQQVHLSDSLKRVLVTPQNQDTAFQSPYGIAMDATGDLFISDGLAGTVTEWIGGGSTYTVHGIVLNNLHSPAGIAVDSQNNIYVAEQGSLNVVTKATPNGIYSGYTLSHLPMTGLGRPAGVAVDGSSNVYVADQANNRIIKLSRTANSYTQSFVTGSTLSGPSGIAVSANGDLFIADSGHNRILREAPSRIGYTESVIDASPAGTPLGVTVDTGGNVFVLNMLNATTAALAEEVPSGNTYVQHKLELPPGYDPLSLVASSQALYLAAAGIDTVARLTPGPVDFGELQAAGLTSFGDGGSSPASLIFTFDSAGSIAKPLVVTQGVASLDYKDLGTGTCTTQASGHVYAAGESCSVDVQFTAQEAGTRSGAVLLTNSAGTIIAQGNVTGLGQAALTAFPPGITTVGHSGLLHPMGVAVDAGGNLYIAESMTGKVYRQAVKAPTSALSVVAQGLDTPTAVAIDGAGNVFIAAADAVYKETYSNSKYTQSKITVSAGRLTGIALDGLGNLYLTSATSGDVHKETLLATGGYSESAIGFGISSPKGIAVDSRGYVYVADDRQGEIYREALNNDGTYAQSVVISGLSSPANIVQDSDFYLYVVDSAAAKIYLYDNQATSGGSQPYGLVATFSTPVTPWGIAVDDRRNIFFTTNTGTGVLARIDQADAPFLHFPATRVGSVSAALNVVKANFGNSELANGEGPPAPDGFRLTPFENDCGTEATGLTDPGTSCLYSIQFTPAARKAYQGGLLIGADGLGGYPGQQTISMDGTGTGTDTTRTTMTLSHTTVARGLGVTASVTVIDTSYAANVPTGGVTLTDTFGNTTNSLNGGLPTQLSGGKASLAFVAGPTGTHTITAHYNGVDASWSGSTFTAQLVIE